MTQIIPESEVQAAIAELEKVRGELMARPGVTAVDVGLRYRGGELTDELAIRVHVGRKLPLEALGEGQRLPPKLGRFPVDVIEVAYEPQPSLCASAQAEAAPECQERLLEVEAVPGVPESDE